MRRAACLLGLLVVLLAGCGGEYASMEPGEASNLATIAIANQCHGALLPAPKVTRSSYAGHKAWLFDYGRVKAFVWGVWDKGTYSVVHGC